MLWKQTKCVEKSFIHLVHFWAPQTAPLGHLLFFKYSGRGRIHWLFSVLWLETNIPEHWWALLMVRCSKMPREARRCLDVEHWACCGLPLNNAKQCWAFSEITRAVRVLNVSFQKNCFGRLRTPVIRVLLNALLLSFNEQFLSTVLGSLSGQKTVGWSLFHFSGTSERGVSCLFVWLDA